MSCECVLIDGDILVYRSAFSAEHNIHVVKWGDGNDKTFEYKKDLNAFLKDNEITEYEVETHLEVEPLANVLNSIKSTISTIFAATKPKEFKIFLTKGDNYRHALATIKKYKGNRDDMRRPQWYREAREYLVKYYDAVECEGIEADDALAMAQTEETVICSIDKDLLQVAGRHFNWVRDEKVLVTPEVGLLTLWMQVLTGDSTDNIPGIKGVGPVTAKKALEECKTAEEMKAVCVEMWSAYIKGDSPPHWLVEWHDDTGTLTYQHWDADGESPHVVEALVTDIVDEVYSLVKVGKRK